MRTLATRFLRSALSRQFASAFVARIASSLLGFLTLLVASRLLDGYEYGVYVFLISIGSALGTVAVFGQQNLILKHYRADDPGGARNADLVRYNFGWLAHALALMLVGSVALRLAAPVLPEPYDRLYLACAFAAVFALSEYLQSYFRIQGSIWLALLPREVLWRGACTLMFLAASLLGIFHGATVAMEITLALFVALTGYQLRILVGHHGWSIWRGGKGATHGSAWRGESLLFTANNALYAMTSYLETVIVGALLGMNQAALYFVALRYATLLTLPGAAIDTVSLPMIASRFQNADTMGAQALIGRLSLASFLISALGAVAMTVLGPAALALFKPDFAAGIDVLLVLSLASVVGGFFGPGGWLLMLGGGERYKLASNAVLFGIYAVLLCGLAMTSGILGVASANLGLMVVSNLATTFWVRARLGVDNMATAYLRPWTWSFLKVSPVVGRESAPHAPS